MPTTRPPRPWTEYPEELYLSLLEFGEKGSLTYVGLSPADAYNARNQLNRLKQAIFRANQESLVNLHLLRPPLAAQEAAREITVSVTRQADGTCTLSARKSVFSRIKEVEAAQTGRYSSLDEA